MERRRIYCFTGSATLGGSWNIPVVYTLPDSGYWNQLFICIKCGELAFIDWSNPTCADQTPEEIAGDTQCPGCGSLLRQTLRPYPQTFLHNGRVGHFEPPRIYPPDNERHVEEIWEIRAR